MSDKQVFANIIDGESRRRHPATCWTSSTRRTGEVYATSPNSGADDVDAACQAAGEAFETYRWTTPSERQRDLLKLADVIEENAEELVAIECENTGKPFGADACRGDRRRWSTRSGSSPARPGCWRASRAVST